MCTYQTSFDAQTHASVPEEGALGLKGVVQFLNFLNHIYGEGLVVNCLTFTVF